MPRKDDKTSPTEPLHLKMADKNAVLKFELNNFDKIALFASGGFWSATQHSCLFMIHLIGTKTKMHVTYDKYIQKDRIFVSFHSGHFKTTQELIESYGCKQLRKEPKILVFQLPEAVTPAQIKAWNHDEDTKAKQIDAYFLPDSGETKLYRLLRDLCRETLVSGDHMRQSVRGLVADRMFALCLEMFQVYMKLNKKSTKDEIAEIYKRMLSLVSDFSFLATVAHDDGLIEDKRMMRMGALLKDLGKALK